MALGFVQPEEQKSVEETVKRNGQMKGVGDLLEPFHFDTLLEDHGQFFHKGVMSLPHLIIQARLDVEARAPAFSQKQPNERQVAAKPFPLDPDIIAQFLNRIIRFCDGARDGILELVGLLQNKRLVQVFLVLEELVKCSDGELGLLGDIMHGCVVISPLREKIERRCQHLFPLPQFFAFPPWEHFRLHRFTSCRVMSVNCRIQTIVNLTSRSIILRHVMMIKTYLKKSVAGWVKA
jgi:hypothetical protein